MISSKTHAIIDYVVAALLVLAPFILGFADGGAAMWVPIILGIAIACYSLLTKYEYAAVRLIPMPVHLALDAGGAIVLIASPWLFGFADQIWWPHVVVGVLEIGVVAMTSRTSHYERTVARDRPSEQAPRGR